MIYWGTTFNTTYMRQYMIKVSDNQRNVYLTCMRHRNIYRLYDFFFKYRQGLCILTSSDILTMNFIGLKHVFYHFSHKPFILRHFLCSYSFESIFFGQRNHFFARLLYFIFLFFVKYFIHTTLSIYFFLTMFSEWVSPTDRTCVSGCLYGTVVDTIVLGVE